MLKTAITVGLVAIGTLGLLALAPSDSQHPAAWSAPATGQNWTINPLTGDLVAFASRTAP